MVQINNFKSFLPFPEKFELRDYNLIRDDNGNAEWKLFGTQFITVLEMKQHHYTQEWFVKVLHEKEYGAITEDWMSVDYLNTLYEFSEKCKKEQESEKND